MDFLRFLNIRSSHLQVDKILLLSFPIWVLFISFNGLIALDRTFHTSEQVW